MTKYLAGAILVGLILGSGALPASPGPSIGLQLYSLRLQAMRDMRAALDQARELGFSEIEVAGTGSLAAGDFAQELADRGLTAIGGHTRYVQLLKGIEGAIDEARRIGAKFVLTSLPKPVIAEIKDEAAVRAIANQFNAWGRACRDAGLSFAYHTHGGEFHRVSPGGETILDTLMRETDPALVCLQMDVYWVYLAGQDPVRLLQQYPGRWRLMHLKDLRLGVTTGLGAASAPATDNVALGDGQIEWKGLMQAAREAGVQYYFIEDESARPLENIPRSLLYLNALLGTKAGPASR